ncbi:hypothetical protein LPJ61_003263 [Coemansia biformis]|uniref:HMG box domain-containing protein n=1 Tax=Coemansia biformis TaxID=1286918 RepID=A0A9W8CVQ2_9FUNG|nr:hypothetical protein LPJ61_003263 [Coemansia biformis]
MARMPYTRPSTDASTPKSPQTPQAPALPHTPRRTYRRHPKKDHNAPEKWRSAYQLFRDDVNRELHGLEIPFAEMSKIHSKRWAELGDDAREAYFRRSKDDKDEYLKTMAVYEKTAEFKQYEAYLDEFYKQDSAVNRVGRPKGAKTARGKDRDANVGSPEDPGHRQSPDSDAAQSDDMSTSPSPRQNRSPSGQRPP